MRGRIPVSRRLPRLHYVRIGNYHEWVHKTHCFDPRLGIKTWGTTGIQRLIPINTDSDASSANVQPGICRLKVIAMEDMDALSHCKTRPSASGGAALVVVSHVWCTAFGAPAMCFVSLNGIARTWAACCPEGRHWPLHDFSTTSNNAWGPDAKRTNVDCATSTPQFIAPWFPDIDSQLMRECGSRMLSWCVSHI